MSHFVQSLYIMLVEAFLVSVVVLQTPYKLLILYYCKTFVLLQMSAYTILPDLNLEFLAVISIMRY